MTRRIWIFLLSGCGLFMLILCNLTPVYLLIRQAFSPPGDATGFPLSFVPQLWSMDNLKSMLASQSLLDPLLVSMAVGFSSTIAALLLGFPAGWALARYRQAENLGRTGILLARVLPPIAIGIPLASLMIRGGLYSHPQGVGLMLAHLTITLPFTTLLAYAAFLDVPRELEEAAWVDGCSFFGGFLRVAIPSVRPAMAVSFILCFMLSWDEFTYAMLIQVTHRTLPPLIYYFVEYGQLGTASTLAIVMMAPVVLIIFILMRTVAKGTLSGGLR